jgi:O-antigen ligase
MGGKAERYIVPAVIGFAPFLLLAVTWGPDGRNGLQGLLLGFYLPLIAIELFVVGVALSEGMVAAMKRWAWRSVPTAALLVLLAIAIVTAVTAPSPATARVWTFYWLVHLGFGLAVTHLCTSAVRISDLIKAYLAGFVLFLAGAVLFATQVTDPRFDWTHGWPAATHIRHYGYYAAAMIALCIGVAASERRPRRLALMGVFATLSFAFVLWTGSRGAVLAVAGALVVGLVLMPALRRLAVLAGVGVSLALGALLASQLPATGGPFTGIARTVTQTVESDDISTGRAQMWSNVWGAIQDRPLFGYGENQMATVAPFGTLGQTHNVILQILLAWGAVGLACVAVLGIWFLVRSLPVVRDDPAKLLAPFMAMLALTSLSLIDGSLFHVLPVSIFAACAGMIAARWRPRPGT